MNAERVSYEVNSKTFEGLHVKPETKNAPCVLIAHTWAGRDGFVEGIANKLAEDGYNAFAIDMYMSIANALYPSSASLFAIPSTNPSLPAQV